MIMYLRYIVKTNNIGVYIVGHVGMAYDVYTNHISIHVGLNCITTKRDYPYKINEVYVDHLCVAKNRMAIVDHFSYPVVCGEKYFVVEFLIWLIEERKWAMNLPRDKAIYAVETIQKFITILKDHFPTKIEI